MFQLYSATVLPFCLLTSVWDSAQFICTLQCECVAHFYCFIVTQLKHNGAEQRELGIVYISDAGSGKLRSASRVFKTREIECLRDLRFLA